MQLLFVVSEKSDFSRTIDYLVFTGATRRACTMIPITNDPKAERVKYFYPFLTRYGLARGVRLFPDITNVLLEDNDGE